MARDKVVRQVFYVEFFGDYEELIIEKNRAHSQQDVLINVGSLMQHA